MLEKSRFRVDRVVTVKKEGFIVIVMSVGWVGLVRICTYFSPGLLCGAVTWDQFVFFLQQLGYETECILNSIDVLAVKSR